MVARPDDGSSFELLQDLGRRFQDETFMPDLRERAEIELIKTTSLFRIAEALNTIDARMRRAERNDERWP